MSIRIQNNKIIDSLDLAIKKEPAKHLLTATQCVICQEWIRKPWETISCNNPTQPHLFHRVCAEDYKANLRAGALCSCPMRCWPVNVPYTLQGLPEQVEEPATNPNGLIAQREEPRQWVLVPNRNRSDSISLEDIFEHVQPFIEPSVDEIKIRLVEQIISSCIASYVAVYSLGESNTKQYYSFLISEIFFDCFLKSKTVFQLTDILSCHMQLNKAALVALCVSDVSRLFISCLIVRYASPNLTLTHIVTYLATRGTLMAFLSARRLRSQIVDSFTS